MYPLHFTREGGNILTPRLEKLFSLGRAFFKSAVARQHPNKEVNFMGQECLICLLFMQCQGKKPNKHHPLLQVTLWFKSNKK